MAVVRRIELLLCLWRIHCVVSASAQAPSTSGKRALRTAQLLLLLLRGYLLMVSERHVLLELGCGVPVVATAHVLVVPLVESSWDVGLGGETTPGTLWAPMVVAHNTVDCWRRGIHTGLLLTRRPGDGEVAN